MANVHLDVRDIASHLVGEKGRFVKPVSRKDFLNDLFRRTLEELVRANTRNEVDRIPLPTSEPIAQTFS